MVTDRPIFSLQRTRLTSAGPLRLLWLAVLLFGVLYSHGLSGESASGHLTGSPVPSATIPEHGAAASHGEAGPAALPAGQDVAPVHHGDETAHAEGCVSGQPQDGADLPVPCLASLDVVAPPNVHAWAPVRSAKSGSASPPLAAPAILRI